jgi:hypothetical protein
MEIEEADGFKNGLNYGMDIPWLTGLSVKREVVSDGE